MSDYSESSADTAIPKPGEQEIIVRSAEKVDWQRAVAQEKRAALSSVADPKWYDYTEVIQQCDLEDLERERRQLKADFEMQGISASMGPLLSQIDQWMNAAHEFMLSVRVDRLVLLGKLEVESEHRKRAELAFTLALLQLQAMARKKGDEDVERRFPLLQTSAHLLSKLEDGPEIIPPQDGELSE